MQTNEVKTKRVHNLIIVDESGSMEVIRKQAFVGMNETLQTVRKMQEKFPDQEQYVTLLTFDISKKERESLLDAVHQGLVVGLVGMGVTA